jgi:hypothetical protein
MDHAPGPIMAAVPPRVARIIGIRLVAVFLAVRDGQSGSWLSWETDLLGGLVYLRPSQLLAIFLRAAVVNHADKSKINLFAGCVWSLQILEVPRCFDRNQTEATVEGFFLDGFEVATSTCTIAKFQFDLRQSQLGF